MEGSAPFEPRPQLRSHFAIESQNFSMGHEDDEEGGRNRTSLWLVLCRLLGTNQVQEQCGTHLRATFETEKGEVREFYVHPDVQSS